MKTIENSLYSDGEIYDAIHGQFMADIAFYEKALPVNSRILEIGVGTGRIAIPLIEKGFNVEGLDPSKEMLEKATHNLTIKGLKMPLHVGDARSFQSEQKFDALFFGGNGLLHLSTPEDFDEFFANAKNLLKEDGFLLIDIFNPDFRFLKVMSEGEYSIGKITHQGETFEIKEQSLYNRTTQTNSVIWTFYSASNEKVGERHFTQRILFPQEIQYILKANGFVAEAVWGNLSFGAFEQESPRQIYKCRPR